MHHFAAENMAKYDQILVIKDGVVAESGNYQQLLAKKELFWELQKGSA